MGATSSFSVVFRIGMVIVTMASGIAATSTLADEPPTWVYGADEKIADKSYREWTHHFFQWALAFPKERSPITDTTGAFASEKQSGPVWFLAGNLGGEMKRKVNVPAGKPICSPILYTLGASEANVKQRMDGATDMEVTLDGKTLTDLSAFRVASGMVEFTGPAPEDAIHPLLAGKRTLAAEGYWIMLKPLSSGEHTLRVKSRVQGGSFELDITYHIKVVAPRKT